MYRILTGIYAKMLNAEQSEEIGESTRKDGTEEHKPSLAVFIASQGHVHQEGSCSLSTLFPH